MKKTFTSGAPWEETVGYSRAVRIHNTIEVSGTTAIEKGTVMFLKDPYLQTKHILHSIQNILIQAGAKMEDVIRTRIYVTDINNWELVGKAHGEFFSDIKPACTLVEVSALIDPEILVEIEVTAILS